MPGRRKTKDDFPLLKAQGLYAHRIQADGACLFHALSDQYYGHPDEHNALRRACVQHMREEREHYQNFINVLPGGGVRRNPKRKITSAANTPPPPFVPPSREESDKAFENYMANMEKHDTWGGEPELNAFSRLFKVNVVLHQRNGKQIKTHQSEDVRTMHLTYDGQHYNSVRNIDGPHTGLPNVKPKPLTLTKEEEDELLTDSPYTSDTNVGKVKSILPTVEERLIKLSLAQCKGDIDRAVNKIMDESDCSSTPSTQASSLERDMDSEDDVVVGPRKRRTRKITRAITEETDTPASASPAPSLPAAPSGQEAQDSIRAQDSQESVGSDSSAPVVPRRLRRRKILRPRTRKPSPRQISTGDQKELSRFMNPVSPAMDQPLQSLEI